jgi:hypothetical protein
VEHSAAVPVVGLLFVLIMPVLAAMGLLMAVLLVLRILFLV